MTGEQAYALAKSYVNQTLQGGGAVVGKNVIIQSIEPIDGGNRITFSYTLDGGVTQTSVLDVMDGKKGEDGEDGIDGFSPIITQDPDNTDEDYRLDITDIDGSFTTPNLKGKDGLDGFSPAIDPNLYNDEEIYRLDITDANGTYTTDNLKGKQGIQGIPGEQGEKGETGQQGIQGVKGEKGDDGYPFLIYKEYERLEDFQASDFPQIGLLFMIANPDEAEASKRPVYRYTGEDGEPYSFVTSLSNAEGIKGEKGDKGEDGEQGVPGVNGRDGTTYTPTIGTVTDGTSASATVVIKEDEKEAEFSFVLPKGDRGDDGEDGITYTPKIGTVTEADKPNVDVTVDANTEEMTFDFKLVRGEKGNDGETPYIKNGTWWYGDTDSGVPIPDIENVLDYVDEVDGIEDTPVGHILATMANNPPKHYLKCDGTVYPLGYYPHLEKHFKEEFGNVNYFGGDGVNTFAVPNLQGEFLRGTGTNSHENQGNGSNVGAHQNATEFPLYYVYENQISFRGDSPTASSPTAITGTDKTIPATGLVQLNNISSPKGGSTMTYAKISSRPTNTSVLYCIKYEPTYFINVNGEGGGSGAGTKDYEKLENLPSINNVELKGNKTLEELNIQPKGNYITEIPENYVTDEEMKEYAQPVGDYLTEIPEEYVTQQKMEEYAQPIGDYSLVSNTGYDLGLSIDPVDYVMYLELKNASGTVLSTKMIDFPLESMVIGASYSNGQLTLSLQNGQTLPPIDISNIVSGLVKDTFIIAGIDMKDEITKEELRTALSVPTKVSELTNDEKFVKESDLEMEDIDFSSYFVA